MNANVAGIGREGYEAATPVKEHLVTVLAADDFGPDCSDIYVHIIGPSADSDCIVIRQGHDEIVMPVELWGVFIERAAGAGMRMAMAAEGS